MALSGRIIANDTKTTADPPTDGLLSLGFVIEDFAGGPASGADEIDAVLDSVVVVIRPRVNGQLQDPE